MNYKWNTSDCLMHGLLLIAVVAVVTAIIYSNNGHYKKLQDQSQPHMNDTTLVAEKPQEEESVVEEPEHEVNMAMQVLSTMKDNRNSRRMPLYDTNGNVVSYCTAYKGKFDGHTWYVFYDNLAVPSVVHDPLCPCGK